MKKTILFISLFVLGASCSKSDDNNVDNTDPVFDAPYEPLKDFSEISKAYDYVGAKIGDRNFGAISKEACLAKNTLVFYINSQVDNQNDSIVFTSFTKDEKNLSTCKFDFEHVMRSLALKAEGKLFVDITDYEFVKRDVNIYPEGGFDTIKKNIYKGELEIGHQAGYLRIEDKFSKYSGKDKVYQYFKKI